jgi:lipopolysaccharide/colanic/teichoic acid biosynthesis glycosyltransferase
MTEQESVVEVRNVDPARPQNDAVQVVRAAEQRPTVPATEHISPPKLACKRGFDLVVGSVLVVLLSPVFLVIAMAILIAEGRPVFYRQRRVGRYGEPFTMLKFRSMVTDAHDRLDEVQHHNERTGPLFKIHKDPRVTRVGRFLRATSLDELPQFFNILGGTMSLVGPRPALFEERESFPPELLEREALRPGLTGLWQVEARSDPDFDKYHQLDLDYVRSWSLWLDVKVLVRTPFVVIRDAATHARRRQAPRADVVPVVALVEAPSQER